MQRESPAVRPRLLNRYTAVIIRQRLSRRMAEGVALGLSLEAAAADLAYLPRS